MLYSINRSPESNIFDRGSTEFRERQNKRLVIIFGLVLVALDRQMARIYVTSIFCIYCTNNWLFIGVRYTCSLPMLKQSKTQAVSVLPYSYVLRLSHMSHSTEITVFKRKKNRRHVWFSFDNNESRFFLSVCLVSKCMIWSATSVNVKHRYFVWSVLNA